MPKVKEPLVVAAVVRPKAEPLNLDAIIDKPKWNRVKAIGVELEGGWDAAPVGEKVIRDGSVYKWAGDEGPGSLGRTKFPTHLFGEIPVGPMIPISLKANLKKFYPTMHDYTCAMHVHMSFERLYEYVLLMDSPAYQETMCEYLTRWAKTEGFAPKHHIWARLSGDCEYCTKDFWPDEQTKVARKDHDLKRYGHRYTAIHYCWNRFKTVECRLLPMMETQAQAIRAIMTVINITNAYLIAVDKGKVKEQGRIGAGAGETKIKLELRKGEVYEEYDQG